MLLLKLFLVPLFLLLLTLAGRRWGPSVAGWLAGLPVVAGPILLFLSLEHGAGFAADAAAAALSAVVASVSFSVAYSHAAQRWGWRVSLALALIAWGVAALCLSFIPPSATTSLAVSLLVLAIAPRLFPHMDESSIARVFSVGELGGRMVAGALLTLAVTFAANLVGSTWSGLLAVFPLLGSVLAVFSHRANGPAFVAHLLRGMAAGLYSFVAFCFALSVSLPEAGIALAFAASGLIGVAVQLLSKRRLRRAPGELATTTSG
ncbi:hypothetical protein ACG02S_15840 [Roseateles sp. DC23W]|uniref:Fusaric acid resistance protein-like n=1 Tax=Pelomonas dachongensis TaxID=3299029 RepID=A0ABW7ESX5_9BURK